MRVQYPDKIVLNGNGSTLSEFIVSPFCIPSFATNTTMYCLQNFALCISLLHKLSKNTKEHYTELLKLKHILTEEDYNLHSPFLTASSLFRLH